MEKKPPMGNTFYPSQNFDDAVNRKQIDRWERDLEGLGKRNKSETGLKLPTKKELRDAYTEHRLSKGRTPLPVSLKAIDWALKYIKKESEAKNGWG